MKLPEPAEYVWEPDGTFDIGQQRQLSTNTGPCGGWNVYPIYTAAQMREYRNQALEEAASVAEKFDVCNVAFSIRNLKEVQRPSTKPEVITDPAEIRHIFEIDEADYPPPDSGFAKL